MGPHQIDDAVDKIIDLLNDGARDDAHAKKYLADLLTDVYNKGVEYGHYDSSLVPCTCPGYGTDEQTKCPPDCEWHGFGQ